ncbi:hypothetical protein SCUCBS95973_001851 [Sporothrix curviconia]|uniref:Uncharacterized protein n=1 Tax=Sporothrix curviconia TaxID=1260050 RepID=A0ABP0B240_9PEZI
MGVSATAAYAVPRRGERNNAVLERDRQPGRQLQHSANDGNSNSNSTDDNNSPTSSGQTGSNEVRIVIQPTRSSRRGGVTDNTSPYVGGSSTAGQLQRQWPMPPGHLGPAVSMFIDESYTATATATGTAEGTCAGTVVEGKGGENGGTGTPPQPYDPTAWSTASEVGGSVTPETQQQYLQYQRYVQDEEERERRQRMLHQIPTRLPVPTQQQPSGLSTRRASGVPSSAVLGPGQQWQQWTGQDGDDGGEGPSNLRFSTQNDSSRSRSRSRSPRSSRSTEILPPPPSAADGSPQGSIGYGRAL